MESESTVVRTGPCPSPTCEAREAYTVYDDGHAYCFSCETFTPAEGVQTAAQKVRANTSLIEYYSAPIPARKLHDKTCAKWSYGLGKYHGRTVQVATYMDDSGNPVAQKIRTEDKRFVILGDAKAMGLYGKWLWREGGRKVAVVEGELDALSLSQLQGLKYAVVSVPNGAAQAHKAVLKDLEWLQGYDEVIFMFDNDEPGRKAAEKCAVLLSPGKAKIAVYPGDINDASQGLVEGKGAAVLEAFWSAKTYRPGGIVTVRDAERRLKEQGTMVPIGRCNVLPGLDEKTRGYFAGQVWMVCSGTGMGKTEFARELEVDMLKQGLVVGHIGLEETIDRSLAGVIGTMVSERLYLEPGPMAHPEWEPSMVWLEDKLYLFDHWGSTEGDELLSKMRYFRVALGCDVVVLDHLSILVSDLADESDERRTIDRLMSKLKAFATETGCLVICVSHLKRPHGTPHEEGGHTSLGQLRGSAGIGQLSNICVGLERNQQCEDNGHITTVRVLKNRKSGDNGVAGYLSFDSRTGRMTPCEKPEVKAPKDFRTAQTNGAF